MKPNKFRVWDVKFEDMFDADNIILDRNDSLSNQINDSDDYKFMQFTGLLDMNGEEVYEKDILKVRVGWDDWKTAPLLIDNLWDIYICINESSRYQRVNTFKVIGNIYENPELIGV